MVDILRCMMCDGRLEVPTFRQAKWLRNRKLSLISWRTNSKSRTLNTLIR